MTKYCLRQLFLYFPYLLSLFFGNVFLGGEFYPISSLVVYLNPLHIIVSLAIGPPHPLHPPYTYSIENPILSTATIICCFYLLYIGNDFLPGEVCPLLPSLAVYLNPLHLMVGLANLLIIR